MEANRLDKLFRDKLYAQENSPSSELWERLSAKLDEQDAASPLIYMSHRASRPSYRHYWVAASIALCMGLGIWQYQNHQAINTYQFATATHEPLMEEPQIMVYHASMERMVIPSTVVEPAAELATAAPSTQSSGTSVQPSGKQLSMPKTPPQTTPNSPRLAQSEAIVQPPPQQPTPGIAQDEIVQIKVTAKFHSSKEAAGEQTLAKAGDNDKRGISRVIRTIREFGSGERDLKIFGTTPAQMMTRIGKGN